MPEPIFPIAEMFYSIQGEAAYTGTPMFFVRLAGCNVGQYEGTKVPGDQENTPAFQIVHPEYATCTSFNGQQFICDTDYRAKERLTIHEIIRAARNSGAHHMNFTGGEPFIHSNFRLLVEACFNRFEAVHIETSGTRPIPRSTPAFITCSPKQGFLKENVQEVDQFKFLVRGPADEEAILEFIHDNGVPKDVLVWVQPVDEMEGKHGGQHQPFAVECVKRHPNWRLSVQVHKVLNVR